MMKKKNIPSFKKSQSNNKTNSINKHKPKEHVDEQDLFKLANFSKAFTGLPMIIWVSEKTSNHVPGIKVSKGYEDKFLINNTFSMSIMEPKIIAGDQGVIKDSDLVLVFQWIKLNEEVLMKYWNLKISTSELVNILKKLP